jgi:hypothetical protein
MSAGAATPKEIGATAFFAHSADLGSRMARVLGRSAEADRYQALFQGIRRAFVKNYVSAEAIIGGTPTGQPVMRDVTGVVSALIQNGRLAFTVKNDVLGGDPVLNKVKTLHIVYRNGDETAERVFAEDGGVELAGKDGKPLAIISAAYGYDATDLGDTQGSYALALQFGLLDEPLKSQAAKRLDALVVKNGHHPTTGFWSSVELLLALSDCGYNAEAATMLNQHEEPSWGYMAEHSTTFWEAFDANTRNLSLNHWTHSAVNEWLWRNVAGLNPDEEHPGYQSFTLHPRPTAEVSWCRASYDSIRGKIVSDWKLTGGQFELKTTIPANTTATIIIPVSDTGAVTESGQLAAQAEGVTLLRSEPGVAVYKVGSGVYQFDSVIGSK